MINPVVPYVGMSSARRLSVHDYALTEMPRLLGETANPPSLTRPVAWVIA